MIRPLLLVALVFTVAGCTTVLGTNIERDRLLPPNPTLEPLGLVSASVSTGHWLWGEPSDKRMYDEARRAALKQKNGDVLINAKITTTLTTYLSLYYTTEVAVEGTAAKVGLPLQADEKR